MSRYAVILIVGLVLLPAAAFGYSWMARYNGPVDSLDQAAAIAGDPTGNVYVTGTSTGSGSGRDVLTVKYSANGDTLWTRRYTSSGNNQDLGTAIAYDASGYVCVAGLTNGANADFVVLKYNATTGALAWSQTYSGPTAGRDSAAAVAVDASGNVYAAGYARNRAHSEAVVVKYNSSGALQWARRETLAAPDTSSAAYGLVIDNSQNPVICGRIGRAVDKYDYLVAKLNAATGDTAWVRRYNGARDSVDVARALAVDASGNVYVTGMSWGDTTEFDYLTLAYTSAGGSLWPAPVRYKWGGRNADVANAIAVDGSGNVYVTGYSTSNRLEDYATLKYGPGGVQRWVSRYNGSNNGADEASSVGVDAQGSVYVTGFSENANDDDCYTMKLDSLGNTVWSHRYNRAANLDDAGADLVVLGPGSVCVTGYSEDNATRFDYLTVKFVDHDLGCVSWQRPTGTQPPQPVVPTLRVFNYGVASETAAVYVWFYRSGALVYSDAQTVYGISANNDFDVAFKPFVGDTGVYVVRCSTGLASDMNRANDTLSATFTFRWTRYPTWAQRQNVPPGPSFKPVKDGAALTYGRYSSSGSAVYCLKGNNTEEFFRCHVNSTPPADTWHMLDSLPFAIEKARRVKKGGALCYDRYDTALYAFKGNNTQEFWKFDIMADTWLRRKDLPPGPAGKRIKGGSGLVFHRSTALGDRVYALKGNKTDELWSYITALDSWEPRKGVPLGQSGKGMGDGSCIVNAGGTFYAVKGSYNEVYAYYPTGDSWVQKESLPMYGHSERRRKAKYGTALAYGNGRVFCIKGNSCEFWSYYPDPDTWVELESMPRYPSGKTAKNGSALTFGNDLVWAIKGNKTAEFWSYDPGADFDALVPTPDRDGAASSPVDVHSSRLTLVPNPLAGGVLVLRLSPPVDGSATVRVVDVTGRSVLTAAGVLRPEMSLDLRNLAAGVYLVNVTAGNSATTQKLVVRRH